MPLRLACRTLLGTLIAVSAALDVVQAQATASPAASAAGALSGAERAAVQQFVRAYVQAHNDADATALMDAVSRDAAVSSVTDGRITRGWEAMRAETDEIAGAEGQFRIAIGTMDVTPLGAGHVLVLAPTTFTVATERGPMQLRGAVTLVLRKRANRWQIVHEHFSMATPVGGG